HGVAVGGATTVVRTATLAEPGGRWVSLDGVELTSHAATPSLRAVVRLSFLGERRIATAVLLPHEHDGSPLPVLLDPYGGPHGPRVVQAHNAHLGSQWFADQGFAVVVADGRSTPGRGSAWERAVHLDLATAVLDDQVEALQRAAEEHGVLDLERVAIRGWSFGGYLAALAVLRRPDVFHAAVAGAPVTEWRLYDTYYTERYLGDPNERPEVYDASSLLPLADGLSRPLLLIHGLADDNVVAAHSLQLSSALLAAGRPHEVLPLVGVTHMTPQETVAEHLLLHQLDFLRRALGIAADDYGAP
ncbi:MAG: prolyl oligopeptidase family serine peptidase, partial [Acidimicrobiia bacterium]|nr:prolyl oligopeptidase family serine peptidase [Acidimicrobiia bacterium]